MKTIQKTKTRNALCGLTAGLLLLAAGTPDASAGLLYPASADPSANHLYIASYNSSRIQKFTPAGDRFEFNGPGAPDNRVPTPSGMAFDSAGNLFVMSITSNQIQKVTPDGVRTVFANTLNAGNYPSGLAFDSEGNLYSANYISSRIQKFTPGGVGSVFAAGGLLGGPTGLAFDAAGNLFVSNINGSIVKFTPGGVGSIFPTGGLLSQPMGLAFDNAGNLFVANLNNSRIIKFTPAGVGSIFASTGSIRPYGLAFDSAGNLFTGGANPWATPGGFDYTVMKFTPDGVGSIFNPGGTANGLDDCKGFAFGPANADALNAPPIASCPPAATIPCTSPGGATRTVTIDVFDADNDALTVTWTVNGVALAPHLLAAGATSDNLTDYPFGFGLNTVSVSVTDGKSDAVTCDTTVTVTAHDAPVPSLASLPTITGECSASITQAPTATDPCAVGGIVTGVSSLGPLPLNFTAQGTYTVTWTYTSPHDGMLSTTQDQTVIVKDITPPTITCPPDVSVAFGSVPAAATDPAGFLAQGGTITDNCDPNGSVTSFDLEGGYCPTIITRLYIVTDAAGNESTCEQTITVNNLFAEDGILWLQPLARKGMSSDTDPSDGGTLKYRFKLGSTIPIKVQAQGCDGNVSSNANVIGKIVVFGDTDMDGVIDANEAAMLIDYNGVGEAGGVMDKVDGKLQFNLDTKKLVQTFKCYILQVTVTDSSTGESRTEIVPLQAK